MDKVQCALNQALREKSDEELLELYENVSATLNDGKGHFNEPLSALQEFVWPLACIFALQLGSHWQRVTARRS
jgi:hypothetical protein